jgi:wyosine [tRNA(Phe)-imidazoG37] synthetase (radical SAM superfamily)
MKYVLGPVPSGRLGRSLGIDPVPLKTCNFNCVYCQLGRTRKPACEREPFIDTNAIATEIREAMTVHGPHDVDWVTLVGSGETTLHSRLGSLIETVKSETDLPVAVITNGSLLYRPDVRQELMLADAVLPSLDAGTDLLYCRVNRPHRLFSFKQHVEGLIEFRQVFDGKLWLEVMLMSGVNDTPHALTAIAAALERIEPDEVHITLPTRPPAEPWVEPPDKEGLLRTTLILGGVARIVEPSDEKVTPQIEGDIIDAVHTIIACHPLREVELVRILGRWVPGRVFETLSALVASGKARVVERLNTRFWCAAETDFSDDEWQEEMLPDGSRS